jgi:hypothetical protein
MNLKLTFKIAIGFPQEFVAPLNFQPFFFSHPLESPLPALLFTLSDNSGLLSVRFPQRRQPVRHIVQEGLPIQFFHKGPNRPCLLSKTEESMSERPRKEDPENLKTFRLSLSGDHLKQP